MLREATRDGFARFALMSHIFRFPIMRLACYAAMRVKRTDCRNRFLREKRPLGNL